MSRLTLLPILLLVVDTGRAEPPASLSPPSSDGYVSLFNGSTLVGWTTSGNAAAWGVENGEIIMNGTDGGWLRTERQFRDFDVQLEFKVPTGGNSGVGMRGSTTGDPAFTGLELQIFDSFGQEPSLTNCGAVYDAIAPTSMAVKKGGEWNEYRIHLVGDLLNVWLNGVQIHKDQHLDDRGFVHAEDHPSPLKDRLTTGYIALQNHGDPVRFRNIRIKDLSPDPDPGDFVPIGNGVDLTGFTPRGGARWAYEDGTLVGRDGPGHLFVDNTWTDVEFRSFVKVNTRGNSGMYFRVVPNANDPDSWPTGYEAQVDQHDPKNFTGCIYDRAWPSATAPLTRDNAWFDYRVRVVGNRIQTWINGHRMVDAELQDFASGGLAVQSHHPGNEIQYRDWQVRIPDAGPMPTEKQE